MGIFDKFRKPTIATEQWARFALDQIFSNEWDKIRHDFFMEMKNQEEGFSSYNEELFIAEILGAQLELLGLVSVHTNMELGFSIHALLVSEYYEKSPEQYREHVKEVHRYCNIKVAEYGKKGISGYKAIAYALAEQLNVESSENFLQRIESEFSTLGEIWRKDAAQYCFIVS